MREKLYDRDDYQPRGGGTWIGSFLAGLLFLICFFHFASAGSLRNLVSVVLLAGAFAVPWHPKIPRLQAALSVGGLLLSGIVAMFFWESGSDVQYNRYQRAHARMERALAANDCGAAIKAFGKASEESKLPVGGSAGLLKCAWSDGGISHSKGVSSAVEHVYNARASKYDFKVSRHSTSITLDELSTLALDGSSAQKRLDLIRAGAAVRDYFLDAASYRVGQERASQAFREAQLASASDALLSHVAPGSKASYEAKKTRNAAQQAARWARGRAGETPSNPIVVSFDEAVPPEGFGRGLHAQRQLTDQSTRHFLPLLDLALGIDDFDPERVQSSYATVGSAMVGCMSLPKGLLCAQILPNGEVRQLSKNDLPRSDADGATLFK